MPWKENPSGIFVCFLVVTESGYNTVSQGIFVVMNVVMLFMLSWMFRSVQTILKEQFRTQQLYL